MRFIRNFPLHSGSNFQSVSGMMLALSIVVVGSCFWPADASGQINLVNVTSCGPESFPATCTIPSTGSGNLLVVGWTGGAGPSLLKSISDNVGNQYTEAEGARAGNWNAGVSVDIWYAANSKAGATSLTLTPTPSGAQGAAVIWEFSGVSTTSPLAQTAALYSQAATTTPTGASVTTTSAGELIISMAAGAQSITGIYEGNPFIEDSLVWSNGWAHLIASSTGAYTAQWNESPSGAYCAGTAAFTAASPGLTYLLTTSPSSYAFGDVLIGSCGTTLPSITLASAGTGPVTMTQIDVTGTEFTASGPSLPFTLAAGYSTPLDVTFCPTTGASVTGTVSVVSNASDSPTDISVSGTGQHNVNLSWSASSGAIGYDVYRSMTSGVFGSTPLNPSLVACCTYTDETVTAGQTYYYVTTAVNSAGVQSGYSNQVTASISSP
jgi:hypothetical protein